MRGTVTIIAGVVLLGLTGCDEHGVATGAPLAGGAVALATLHAADGTEVGRATAREVAGGLRVTIDTHGLRSWRFIIGQNALDVIDLR